MKRIALLSLAVIIGAIASARGGVVLSDTFNYPDGPLVTAGSPWQNHSGTAGSMLVSNNTLLVSRSRSEDVNASLAGAPYLASDASAKLYSSFTMVISNDLPTRQGTYFAHFRGTNSGALTDFGARVFATASNIVTKAPVPTGYYRLSIANGAGAGSDNNLQTQIDQDLAAEQVYTVVTRFVPSTGIATLWINPTSESDPSVSGTDTSGTVPNAFNVFTYAFRQATGEGTVYVDDLKVGTSFADVAGANTAPLISSISLQSIAENGSTGPLDFTVADAESAATSLTVSATSTNTALVPNNPANIFLQGTGTNRSISITPVTGQQGATLITVTVTDGVNSSFTTFLVRVGAPSISAIDDQVTVTNTPITIPFTVWDAETPNGLSVNGSSSNPGLVQDSKIVVSTTGTNRTVTITPEPDASGLTTVTLTVTDGNQSDSVSFILAVAPKLGPILTESFTYSDGVLPTVSSSKWVAHSSIDSNDLFVANEKLILSQTNSMDANSYFDGFVEVAPASGTVLYSKFDVNFEVLPRFGGGYFAHFKDTATSNFRDRIYAQTNGAAPGKFRLGVANGAASVSVVLPRDLDLNTTYTVVTRLVVATGKSTLWVNPRYETDPSVTATDIVSPISIWTYAVRQDGTSGGIGVMTLDDLVIGTSFTDVVPYVAPPSPIPLAINRYGNDVVLTWSDNSFKLQSASTITGTFSDVNGATSPYTNTAAAPVFFRLKY